MGYRQKLYESLTEDQKKEFTYLIDEKFSGDGTVVLQGIVKDFLPIDVHKTFQKIYLAWLEMKKLPSGPSRAKALQSIIDATIKNNLETWPQAKKITCTKGCAHCCKMEVLISDDEAQLLAKKVRAGLEIDMSKLKSQAKLVDADAWVNVPEDKRRCVFLGEDNFCKVYDDRPLNCRKYFVTSTPANCNDINGNSLVYAMHGAEIIASASTNLRPLPLPLAAALLKRLENS